MIDAYHAGPLKNGFQALAKELHTIAHHERAEAILMNDWVNDETLPIPSVEAILFLAWQQLGDHEFYAMLDGKNHAEGIDIVVQILRKHSEQDFENWIAGAWPQMEAARQREFDSSKLERGASKEQGKVKIPPPPRAHEWSRVIDFFHYFSPEDEVDIWIAQRGIARRLVEALTLRAVLLWDVPALESLVEVMKRGSGLLPAKPQNSEVNLVAAEVLCYMWRVLNKIPDCNKASMEAFILELNPQWQHRSGSPNFWAAVWKQARFSPTGERSGPRNRKQLAIEFAKEIRNEEIKMGWRKC